MQMTNCHDEKSFAAGETGTKCPHTKLTKTQRMSRSTFYVLRSILVPWNQLLLYRWMCRVFF